MVTVPNVVSHVPHLSRNPVAAYVWDHFQKPYPFMPDVVVDIGEVVEKKVNALHCHTSQMYEWLPYNRGELDQVPEGDTARREWLRKVVDGRLKHAANLYREKLVELYGEERGNQVEYAEAYEICEYGAPVSDARLKELFPFFGRG